MKVGIYRDDAIHRCREQPADRFLADRFALVEGCVLAHVTEIGREQHEPSGAHPSQRFRGEQDGDQLVVRLVKGSINDRRRGGSADRHAQFPVGKTVQRDFPQKQAKPRGQPSCIVGRGGQALNDELPHSVGLSMA